MSIIVQLRFTLQFSCITTINMAKLFLGKIRDRDENPGLRECEASLVRLVDKVTNGSRVEINETGTRITFVPGKVTLPT